MFVGLIHRIFILFIRMYLRFICIYISIYTPLLLNQTRIFSSLLFDLTKFSILSFTCGIARLSTVSMIVSSPIKSNKELAKDPPISFIICLITNELSLPTNAFIKLYVSDCAFVMLTFDKGLSTYNTGLG